MPLPQIMDIIGIAAQPLDLDCTSFTVKPTSQRRQACRADGMIGRVDRRHKKLPNVIRDLSRHGMMHIACE